MSRGLGDVYKRQLLALLTTGLALMTLSSSLRDAEAINLAGSLRMQSYRLAWDSISDPQQIRQHLLEYKETLNKPALRDLDRPWVPQEVISRYHHLRTAWPALQQQLERLSLIHISEPTRHTNASRMPSSA